MITFTSDQLHLWIASFLWPLTRILGVIATTPLFGNISIPPRVKIGLGIMLAIIIAPGVPAMPATDPMSLQGLLILVQQFIIGAAMGFTIRVVLAAMEMAGEIIGMTMGLGFATFFDPQTQGRSPAISQFLALLALMIYLASNLHLVVLSVLADSFVSLPISAMPITNQPFMIFMGWGGRIFSAGVQLALPIIAALLITNIALGILTRAAPQLNLFGIGFPVTICVGFVMIGVALPYMATPLERLFYEGFTVMRHITSSSLPPIQ
ncbi:MAG: flagellar biosynthetic protein FliR [Oxalobacter sp.]|nr:MAG: flagellar biosynthetic protein FliR [Oxalobacter sp.]